ncbi:MAG: glycosyltransferase [Phycisphaerae bacterium]
MRVFMLGWEFPPFISGGLGTACQGLTKGLCEIGVDVIFVLPQAVPVGTTSHVKFRSPTNLVESTREVQEEFIRTTEGLTVHRLSALLQPYGTPRSYEEMIKELMKQPEVIRKLLPQLLSVSSPSSGLPVGTIGGTPGQYQGDLMGQVNKYARLAVEMARRERFDVVHAHDWMTYPAGVAAAAATGRPLVVHVHSTEFDRSGENVNQQVYDIERAGMHAASKVVCVSHFTRNIVLSRYGVPAEKVEVVYNAVEIPDGNNFIAPIRHTEKIVLFLGRVTMQKGPEYFLQAARKVVDKFPDVRFVMAGSGDMITQCIRLAADLKLGGHVTFTGFLRGNDVARIYQMADLYVMPSVSEPFGIAPLEAISHNVPVIISKTSGVSEVLTHALKVDFWDIDEMANKILAVLRHAPLQKTLRQHGQIELRKLSWKDSAVKLAEIYQSIAKG